MNLYTWSSDQMSSQPVDNDWLEDSRSQSDVQAEAGFRACSSTQRVWRQRRKDLHFQRADNEKHEGTRAPGKTNKVAITAKDKSTQNCEDHSNIFVSTVGHKVERWKICVHREQVQTQQHYKNLNDDPNQSSACTQTKNLWAEPFLYS